MSASIKISVKVPETILGSAIIRNQIERVMRRKTGPEIKRLFGKTVEGWNKKPDFSARFVNRQDLVSVKVWATGRYKNKYALVNFGSPKHIITPRKRGFLHFQSGYDAATKPRTLSSHASSRYGVPIRTQRVSHPGFDAREFDAVIAERIAETFSDDIQKAIGIGVKMS